MKAVRRPARAVPRLKADLFAPNTNPRYLAGQVSATSGAPTAHSPAKVKRTPAYRATNAIHVGADAAMGIAIENIAMLIDNTVRRPYWSANQGQKRQPTT